MSIETQSEFNYIRYEVREKIGIIILARPEKRNALNDEVVGELLHAFSIAEEDDGVKLVLLKAEGKVFCAGADLEYLEKISTNSFSENLSDSEKLKNLFYKIYSLKKIVVAQIEGHAIAGGTGLASVCDFSFAVPGANFGYTEVRLGFLPAIVSVFLIRKIGEGKARELLLTGKIISADEAAQYGVITKVIAASEIEAFVEDFAKNIIENTSRLSVDFTKELLAKTQELNLTEGLTLACEFNAKARTTNDFKKGVGSFLKKEKLEWD